MPPLRSHSQPRSVFLALACGLLAAFSPGCSESVPDESADALGATGDGLGRHRRPPSQAEATFTTAFTAPLVTEGLAADSAGNLYTAGRGGTPCPIYRAPARGGNPVVVGTIPAPCNPNGLAFDKSGTLFVTSGADRIYRLLPDATTPPTAALFASGVPGANGLAFDRRGGLWVTDGGTGQGRVWRIGRDGSVAEKFRIQPLANTVNVVEVVLESGATVQVGGVGRDARALPPGALTITASNRAANDTAGSVAIVANGIAFTRDGSLLVTDTARGAIWKVAVNERGDVRSSLGCDSTFTANTLCLENLLVQHPALEGVDGIVVDSAGTSWVTANERNSIVYVSAEGQVRELFRNEPEPTTLLRNAGPLEFPTTPALIGRSLCVAQTDVARRDNFPNGAGEVGPSRPSVSKVSCLDQLLPRHAL